MEWLTAITTGFQERMRNLAIFFPLLSLSLKTKYPYSMLGLGFATMLYILENMLQGKEGCTYDDIATFLQQLIRKHYYSDLAFDDAKELTLFLVRDGLMNGGKPHMFRYPDFEGTGEREIKFHLIELQDYEIGQRKVFLKLSTSGVELLFKTKEMFSELQVSISQLYLRQQLEKGVFTEALRSVEELALAVQQEKAKLVNLEHSIRGNVLKVLKDNELQEQITRINFQLNRERDVFRELEELVKHTMDEYYNGALSIREEAAITTIYEIRQKLLGIISLHETLFEDKLKLQQLVGRSIEGWILTTFRTKLNFEAEILARIIESESLEGLIPLIRPIFPYKRSKFFDLNKLFDRHSIRTTSNPEALNYQDWDHKFSDGLLSFKDLELVSKKQKYFEVILRSLESKSKVKVSQLLSELQDTSEQEHLNLMLGIDFYPFMIRLHQMGVINLRIVKEECGLVLDAFHQALLQALSSVGHIGFDGFEVRALEDIISLPVGYKMSDFLICVIQIS